MLLVSALGQNIKNSPQTDKLINKFEWYKINLCPDKTFLLNINRSFKRFDPDSGKAGISLFLPVSNHIIL